MTVSQYFREIVTTMPKIARETGHSLLGLYLRFVIGYVTRHITLPEFQTFALYKLSLMGVSEYLTAHQKNRFMKDVNAGCTPEDFDAFNKKHLFNTLFRDFIQREWLYLPDCTEEKLRTFLQKPETFLLKPTDGMQGRNIRLFHPGDITPEEFIDRYGGTNCLLERFIPQHPAMATLNPTSVNTVRIITVRYRDRLLLLGAGLRCGGPGAHVDNYHTGGSAYPIDLDTGVISGPGKTLDSESALILNPSCGEVMPGFRIPHWDILLEQVKKAAYIPEHIGYVAWDVAITEDGVEFVEGNVDHPGVTIIQLNGQGVYRKLRDFLKS